MKKNLKKLLFATLSLSAVGILSAGAMSVNYAKAEELEQPMADLLVKGASVYLAGSESDVDKNGMRFEVLAKKELIQNNATIGAVVLPADLLGENELTVNTTKATNDLLEIEKWNPSSTYTDYMYTYVYMYNFPVSDYNRDITVRAYLTDGENYDYSDATTRSMAYVAWELENLGSDVAADYIKEYHVNYFGEDGVTELSGMENVGVRYGSLPTQPEAPAETATKQFVGWYADKACTQAFDFTKPVKGTTNIYSKWVEKYIPPFATRVSINGGALTSAANFTYGDAEATTADWYYNKTTGALTKTFNTQTGGSDFNDRVYIKDGQTGDFTFTVTATLEHNAGFEFTYNTGSAINRYFIGRGWNGLRVSIGDAQRNAI